VIELIVRERCTSCGNCVKVCPTNVFDLVDGKPVIARQLDCQTCFMCELYCRADALFVATNAEGPTAVDAEQILTSGLLGEYRRDSGWDEWEGVHPNLFWRQGELFARGRLPEPPPVKEERTAPSSSDPGLGAQWEWTGAVEVGSK
jgi:NAD-dependent dihydropyrimidine dehydrogenase PreA subunit